MKRRFLPIVLKDKTPSKTLNTCLNVGFMIVSVGIASIPGLDVKIYNYYLFKFYITIK